jgi:hypothetical protein
MLTASNLKVGDGEKKRRGSVEGAQSSKDDH